jgi:hypothetical protein
MILPYTATLYVPTRRSALSVPPQLLTFPKHYGRIRRTRAPGFDYARNLGSHINTPEFYVRRSVYR